MAQPARADALVRVRGAEVRYRRSVIGAGDRAIDWFPANHAPPPRVVALARPGAYACGYCHLPGGEGRPENASLAGLPAAYIERQVKAFASGARKSVRPDWGPAAFMVQTAKAASAADLAQAAAYFSHQRFTSRVRVVETAAAPATAPRSFVYARIPGQPAPLARDRIVETPREFDQFELRDPRTAYIAYVPRGAIARGAELARTGGPAKQPCAACHGAGLGGGAGPPLAGRSPTYIVRQLMAFRTGARSGPDAAPMAVVSAGLSEAQMVDLAAYAASRGGGGS